MANTEFIKKIEKFGLKLCANDFIASLQEACMGTMPVILISALFQVIAIIMYMAGVSATSTIYIIMNIPYKYSMGFMGVWITCLLSFCYARKNKLKSPMQVSIQATMMFLLTSCFSLDVGEIIDTTYLGSQGMFLGFVIAFLSVKIDLYFQSKKISISISDNLPPSFVKAMEAVPPVVCNGILCVGLSAIVYILTDGSYNVASGFMALLAYPLNALVSVPGLFILGIIVGISWGFGIHGTAIVASVLAAPTMMATSQNAKIYEAVISAGGSIKDAEDALIFAPCFLMSAVIMVGGTGNTWPLAFLGLKAKSKQLRSVARTAIMPGWFGINEPITFGYPIMYNPILIVPYILNIIAVMTLTLIGYKVGFLVPNHIYIGTLLPIGVGEFLGSLNIKNAIWAYLMIIPCTAIWYPFFRKYDDLMYEKEQQEEKADKEDS